MENKVSATGLNSVRMDAGRKQRGSQSDAGVYVRTGYNWTDLT